MLVQIAPESLIGRKQLREPGMPPGYRDAGGFEDLSFDRSATGFTFGANGSCQCRLTILVVASVCSDLVFGGIIVIGVTTVLSSVGPMLDTSNLSAFVEVTCSAVVASTRYMSALASGAAPILIPTSTPRLAKPIRASQRVLII
jgi:hypothetical protein